MKKNYYFMLRFIFALFTLVSVFSSVACLSGNDGDDNSSPLGYDEINIEEGFSKKYLSGKTFYKAIMPSEGYPSYLKTVMEYKFNENELICEDSLEDTLNTYSYDIIDHEDMNGVIAYKNVYTCYFTLTSVEKDYLEVCYSYGPYPPTTSCDSRIRFYFDRMNAEEYIQN